MAANDDLQLHATQTSQAGAIAEKTTNAEGKSADGTLRIFYQDGREKSKLRSIDSVNLTKWSPATQIEDVGLTGGPSPVWFQGKLYVFHQADDRHLHNIYYNVYHRGSWLGETQVPDTTSASSPSAVVFEDRIVLLHSGSAPDPNQLWYNVFDGKNWAGDTFVGNIRLTDRPSGVVFKDKVDKKEKVYYFFQSGYGDHSLWYSQYDGKQLFGYLPVPESKIEGGPSAVVFNGKIYIFHKGGHDDGLWYSVFNGDNFESPHQVPGIELKDSPAAIVLGTQIVVFYQGGESIENDLLWYNTFNGKSWTEAQRVPHTTLFAGPGVVLADH